MWTRKRLRTTKNVVRRRLFVEVLEGREVPATFTVDSTGDGGDANLADGVAKDANNQTTLRAAIEQGNDLGGTHTINFSATVFSAGTVPIQIPVLNSKLELTASFTINGPTNVPVELRPIYMGIPGQAPQTFPIMEIGNQSASTIKYLTLTGARWANGAGGGILNTNVLTLENCQITDCQALGGGGIMTQKTLTLTNCTLSGNKATNGTDGGAILTAVNIACVTTIEGTTITNNEASKGGGIAVLAGAQVIINGGQLTYNLGTGQGGGIYSSGGTLRMTGTNLEANTAGDGGGLYNSGGTSTLQSVTIKGNAANNWGGGIWAKDRSSTYLTSCTFDGNTANVGGPKVAYTGTIDDTTIVSLVDCTGIVASDRKLVM